MWENTTPSTELPRDFCAGIGPLQLGVVLVKIIFTSSDKFAFDERWITYTKIVYFGFNNLDIFTWAYDFTVTLNEN